MDFNTRDHCLWALRQWTHNYRGEPTGVTAQHTAHMFNTSPATIHRHMRRLIEDGLAIRQRDLQDRKFYYFPGPALNGVNRSAMPR